MESKLLYLSRFIFFALINVILISCSQEKEKGSDQLQNKQSTKVVSNDSLLKPEYKYLSQDTLESNSTLIDQQVQPNKNVKIKYRPYGMSPFDLKVMRIEIESTQSDHLVLIDIKDRSVMDKYPFTVPEKCNKYYSEHVNKMDLDSLSTIFSGCVDDFYSNGLNKARRDTLFVLHSIDELQGISNEEIFFTVKTEVYNSDTSEYMVSDFYSIDELRGVDIVGDYFRKKSIESWKEGKEHGIWKYFNKEGEMVKSIVYNMGNIESEENY